MALMKSYILSVLRWMIGVSLVVFGFMVTWAWIFSAKPAETDSERIAQESAMGEGSDAAIQNSANNSNVITKIAEEVAEKAKKLEEPAAINLRPTVDEWLKDFSGEAGVLIYDLDNEKVVAKHNADQRFPTASLYKLFVVYEGYRRVIRGEWSLKEYGKCLDLAIRESNSACAEKMRAKIGKDKLDQIIERDFKITDSDISALVATPRDIAKMLKFYAVEIENTEYGDLSPQFSAEIQEKIRDSMLNQPVTTYDWRRGLPAGFSERAKVYDKVGWEAAEGYWKLYHDAAVIEIDGRHYLVVVMTRNAKSHKEIAKLGEMLEAAISE